MLRPSSVRTAVTTMAASTMLRITMVIRVSLSFG